MQVKPFWKFTAPLIALKQLLFERQTIFPSIQWQKLFLQMKINFLFLFVRSFHIHCKLVTNGLDLIHIQTLPYLGPFSIIVIIFKTVSKFFLNMLIHDWKNPSLWVFQGYLSFSSSLFVKRARSLDVTFLSTLLLPFFISKSLTLLNPKHFALIQFLFELLRPVLSKYRTHAIGFRFRCRITL